MGLSYFTWDYLISPDKWALGKVNAFSNTTIFNSLKGRMNDSHKKMFRETCFAHFLDVEDIVVNHQLIHQVLLREVKQPNPDEMWFKIGDNVVSFTIEDFCQITGLGVEGEDKRSIFDSRYCRIKNEYLNHLSSISTSDVSQFFINSAYLCDEDVVRFGLLYLLTNLMFTATYKRSVEESLMVLVDSPEFNSYAWGKELFKITMSSLKAGLRNKSLIIEGDGKPYLAYRICGFVIAFQVWIYETIPILDGKICTKIGSRSPRMLNWTSRVNGTFNYNLNVGKDIFGRPDLKTAEITAQLEDRMQHYTHDLYDDSHVQRVEDSDDEFVTPLACLPSSKSKKHAGDASSSQTIIEVVQNTQTVTAYCHLNLEKTIDNASSPNINFNAKSVEKEATLHKYSDNQFEQTMKTGHTSCNFSTNGIAGKLDKKECCFSKESIMRSLDALQSKHEQVVHDQLKMKTEIHNLFTDFAKSIVHGIEAVTSIVGFDQVVYNAPPQPSMQNDKNHVAESNATIGMQRSATTRCTTRPHQLKTSPEIEIPSFDLGIESQSHENHCIVLEDGLILTAGDIRKIDDTVATTRTTLQAIQDPIVGYLEGTRKKRRTSIEDIESDDKVGNEANASAPISLLDDEIIFSEEDFRHMDESAEKSRCRAQKRPAKPTTPIPLNFECVNTPVPQKRTTKPAACIRSPFVRSFHSQPGDSSHQLPTSFQYNICMESPKSSDVQAFLKWYNIGLRAGNKLKKFHKDELSIRPPHELGPVSIRDKMWWYSLKQVATPLNTMVKSSNGKVRIDSNSVDKLNPLIAYTNGHSNRFNSSWGEVDHVFIPVFTDKKAHWILLDLDMSNLHLNVYNSSFKTIRDVAVLDAVEPFRQMIPHIIRHSNILTHDIPDNPLTTTLCKDIPHQTNGGDCGIFVIKFAEYIAENKIKEMPKNFDTKVARLNMATQLYKFACEKPYSNISG